MFKQSSWALRTRWRSGLLTSKASTSFGRELVLVCRANCGQDAPIWVAWNVPPGYCLLYETGGFNLRGPTGGSAKGMPRKESMPLAVVPMMVPLATVTEGPACLSSRGAAVTAEAMARRERPSLRNMVATLCR